jgi:thiol-disulfide isomerase/thioredoxin
MTWRRTPLLVVVLAAAIIASGVLLWRQLAVDSTRAAGGNTDSAPLLALTLPDAAGKQETLAQWKGKVLIVNFWATWCEPCKEEMPRFIKLQEEYGAKGLQFVGVAIDQADKVRAFAQDIGLNYPTLVGGYGAIELSKTMGNNVGALPFTVVLDRGGAVVHTQLGPLKDQQLLSIIRQLT